ncbi:enoyl-CoA delta isomerase 3, peroxisomal-like [Cochliomyia hominivorax]
MSTLTQETKQNKRKPAQLIVQQQEEILIIKINCLEKKNSLNRSAIYELVAAVSSASNTPEIKVVVLTGVGDIFTAGNDLKQLQDYKNPEDFYRGCNFVLRVLVGAFLECPKLLVCLINGPCIGIGFTLAALCDAVYATKNAYLHTPFTQLGICPEACSTWTFPQQFGKSWSTNLLLFGEKLFADKAKQLGFILEVFDNNEQELEEKFWRKIREYSKLPWDSLRITKLLINRHYGQDLMKALNWELNEIHKLRQGPVYKKAMEKFIQKSLNVNKSKL